MNRTTLLTPTTTFIVLLLFSAGPVFAPAQTKEEARYAKQLANEEARYAKQLANEEARYAKQMEKAAQEQVKQLAQAAQTPEERRYAKEMAQALKEQAKAKEQANPNKDQTKPNGKQPPVGEWAAITARPEMFGYGHWPKGTPQWFIQLDEDHDGQVGLYEWHARGLRVADYLALDQNDDGLLTFEEWFQWTQQQADAGQPTTFTPSGYTREKPAKGPQGR